MATEAVALVLTWRAAAVVGIGFGPFFFERIREPEQAVREDGGCRRDQRPAAGPAPTA